MGNYGIYGKRKGKTGRLIGVVFKAKNKLGAFKAYARQHKKGQPSKIRIYKVKIKKG
jgi:hypothetical protein